MKKFKLLSVILLVALLIGVLSGCAGLSNLVSTLKGELWGNDYTIYQYDNFGSPILKVTGDKVTLSGELNSSGELSSYIDITIDGYEWLHVGGTLVFAQNGVDVITDFQMPENITTSGDTSTGLMAADRYINHYRNLFGKKSVIIISSQTGAPVCLLQGDSVYTEVPGNLPKTTRLNIDGKAVYVHRANVDIMPVAMFFSR